VPPTLTPIPSGINISGVITNLDEARPYLTEASYLQLVVASDEVTFMLDASFKEVRLDSHLAKIPIPPDGVFSFQVENLEAGKYFVTAQKFNPADMFNFHAMVLARVAGKPESIVIIEIPENVTLPFSFDMGEVVIILP
jgi:hypothetical protein